MGEDSIGYLRAEDDELIIREAVLQKAIEIDSERRVEELKILLSVLAKVMRA